MLIVFFCVWVLFSFESPRKVKGAMYEENNRAAICAVIRSSTEHLTKSQIANKAGTKATDYDHHFVQLFIKSLKEAGDSGKEAQTIRAGVIKCKRYLSAWLRNRPYSPRCS